MASSADRGMNAEVGTEEAVRVGVRRVRSVVPTTSARKHEFTANRMRRPTDMHHPARHSINIETDRPDYIVETEI